MDDRGVQRRSGRGASRPIVSAPLRAASAMSDLVERSGQSPSMSAAPRGCASDCSREERPVPGTDCGSAPEKLHVSPKFTKVGANWAVCGRFRKVHLTAKNDDGMARSRGDRRTGHHDRRRGHSAQQVAPLRVALALLGPVVSAGTDLACQPRGEHVMSNLAIAERHCPLDLLAGGSSQPRRPANDQGGVSDSGSAGCWHGSPPVTSGHPFERRLERRYLFIIRDCRKTAMIAG
jgi:hypothetical protein